MGRAFRNGSGELSRAPSPRLRACLRGVEYLGHGGRETGEQRRLGLAAADVHAVLGVAIRAQLEHRDGLVAGIDDPVLRNAASA